MQERYDAIVAETKSAYGFRIRRWRKSMSGCAWQITYRDGRIVRLVEAPYPKGPLSAAIYLHEVGHHAIGLGKVTPRCLEEYQAWMWSLAAMEHYGLTITDRVHQRVGRSLRYAVAKARRRGLRNLPDELGIFEFWPYVGEEAAGEAALVASAATPAPPATAGRGAAGHAVRPGVSAWEKEPEPAGLPGRQLYHQLTRLLRGEVSAPASAAERPGNGRPAGLDGRRYGADGRHPVESSSSSSSGHNMAGNSGLAALDRPSMTAPAEVVGRARETAAAIGLPPALGTAGRSSAHDDGTGTGTGAAAVTLQPKPATTTANATIAATSTSNVSPDAAVLPEVTVNRAADKTRDKQRHGRPTDGPLGKPVGKPVGKPARRSRPGKVGPSGAQLTLFE